MKIRHPLGLHYLVTRLLFFLNRWNTREESTSNTHCITLQQTASPCNTVQHALLENLHLRFEITLQHTATHCNTLQHTATHCSILQHTATHCSTLQHTAAHCNTLQHTAAHCNTLQHTAAHCNTLQHTLLENLP